MKTLSALLVTLLTCTILQAQHRATADTLLSNPEAQHYIYIDRKAAPTFPNLKLATQTPEYKADYARLLEHTTLKTYAVADVPRQWQRLYQYRDSFYLYDPCDGLFDYALTITDSTFIEFTGEGPFVSSILEYERTGENAFRFWYGTSYQGTHLTIHIVDAQKGLAVFAFNHASNRTYSLMAAVQKGFHFPTIVCYTGADKQFEFDFQEPDYKALLQNKKL